MDSPKMTVEERLDTIEKMGWPIAYDGCHKIYFLEDAGREAQARELEYHIHPASELRELWNSSCGLRFVSRWGYDNDDFDHPLNINQFENEDTDEDDEDE